MILASNDACNFSMRQIHLLELLKLKITQKVSSSVETKVWYPEEVSFQFNYRYCEPKKFLFKECHAASAADAAGASFFFFVVSVDFWNLNLCEICWWCMRGQNISIVSSYFHFFLLDVVQQKYKHFAHGQGSVLLQRIACSIDAGQLNGSNIFSLDYEIYIWLVGSK